MINFAFIWALIIGFAIIMYVLLDGFDLGVGILFALVKNSEHHDIMMSTISPVWDGNETWLVFGAASLYAAFPVVYSVMIPTLYLPIMLMLVGLVFRGVCLEFRFKALKTRFIWDNLFSISSILVAFLQGILLATFVRGLPPIDPNHIVIPNVQWLTPFNILIGIALVFGYSLLGATWLIAKTVGKLQAQMYKVAKGCLIGVTAFLILVSIFMPFINSQVLNRWFNWHHTLYLAVLPLLTAISILFNWRALAKKYEHWPFWLSISLYLFAYIGFIISVYPYAIPYSVTYLEAAAPNSSLIFILVGAVILLPVLLGYTFYAYRVFRGKVTASRHY